MKQTQVELLCKVSHRAELHYDTSDICAGCTVHQECRGAAEHLRVTEEPAHRVSPVLLTSSGTASLSGRI